MTPQDFAALHARAFHTTRAWSSAEFATLLGQNGVSWHGDHRCFVITRVVADEAEILTLATDPAHRRQGLARVCAIEAEQAVAGVGAKAIFLEVGENNTAARALYDDLGYRQVGSRPNYYLPKDGAPIAALVLRKELKTTTT
ncbi:MAG: N-acetyltransferase [Pseudomonadota bacterium]